jgi:glyoxylate/hydroxypyruvate reductase A
MVLVTNLNGASALPAWQALFAQIAPQLEVRGWHEADARNEDVHYALVWRPETGRLAGFPNLRLILSAGAGVDHILADTLVPPGIPIVRLIPPEMVLRMGDFVTMSALALTRDLPMLVSAQRHGRWAHAEGGGRIATETTVGVMGVGTLGAAVAARLVANGFKVIGWSRAPKRLAGVECYEGSAALKAFLSRSQIIVNLLPNTPETHRILDGAALGCLPDGAGIINVGRGSHLNRGALLECLDSGKLGAAILDVFDVEPLPANDPLWCHPKVWVMPHIASLVSRPARARQVAHLIELHRAGKDLPHLYDPVRGY